MKRSFLLSLFSLLIVFLLFCDKKEEEIKPSPKMVAEQLQEKLDLDEAIVETPPAIVPITASLDIKFREPAIPNHLRGITLDKNPFTFEPNVEGRAEWVTQQILRFIPDKNLPAGQTIKVILHGKTAFGEQKNVNDFSFSFKVSEQEVLYLEGDFVAVPDAKNSVRYTATISFAQPVELREIADDIVLKGPNREIDIQVTQDEQPDKVKIVSEVIVRTVDGQSFTVSLPGRYTANREQWKQELYLPGIDVFRVLAHADMTSPEMDQLTYGFRFNDPIKKNIDLSGYVSVTPELPYEVRIKGKHLMVQGDFLPGKTYRVKITKGFPSIFGTKLTDDYATNFSFNNIKPEVKWLSEGTYLPTDNQYKLQFNSVNVRRVYVTVTEIYPQNMGFFIQTNTLADESNQNQRRRGRYYSQSFRDLSRVGERIFDKRLDITHQKNKWLKTELDLSPVFKDKKNSAFVVSLGFNSNDLTGSCVNSREDLKEDDLFFESDNYYENPCQGGYYYSQGNLNKLLISSDIALTVKKADDGIHVFATNVLTARPVDDLILDMYSYLNELIEVRKTDSDGHALFSDSNKGFYISATNSSGIALLKLDHPAWELNNFDVAGSSGGVKGTDVFIYIDRGVHRPGDTIHLSAIIRLNRKAPPEKQPVILQVRDPKGQIVHDTKTESGFNGHVYFPITTDISDPTGDWVAELSIGDQKFRKTLKIETVKPNRLKIEIDLPREIHPPQLALTGTISSKYLFGAPASNLRTNIKADLTGRNFVTSEFRDYIFSTPIKQFSRRSQDVFEGNLNDQGIHQMSYKIPNLEEAPSLVQAILNVTVYEKGGSFVEARESTTIFPFNAFVGLKNVFQHGSARVGENYEVPIIVVNQEGQPVVDHKLRVRLYVNREHWWYDYDRRDKKDFRSMQTTYLIGEYSYSSKETPIKHKITVEDYGRHFIEVIDQTSGHETGLFFYASGWGQFVIEDEKERNYLQISSNKNVYSVGDDATLTFNTPNQGMALFSLEQGNKIIRREWKLLEANRTYFAFRVTDEMIPNCYASISVIQPHNQNTNDLPMRLYGIKNVYVEEPSTHLPLSLSVPDELEPKKPFTVNVTSQALQKATYTIAIVDEGLLDLTGFKTPLPWDHYFKKLRLGIQTLDNFDDIIGVLFPDIDKYFSIGGDYDEIERKKRLARSRVKRFEPVVLFHQPITIDPGQTIKTSMTMPNYVGSVRIMVIGTSGHSYTSLEETVPVRQPLMILTTLPRVARPGDTFALPVSVFAMDSTINNVNLSLSLSSNLTINGPETIAVPFMKPGEKDAVFSVSVGSAVGADTATVVASSESLTTDDTVHLPITSPNPFYTEVTDTLVQRGQIVTLIPKKIGLEGTNSARLAFTRLPDIQLNKRISYLIRYPYGCVEQTVSSAFPQIFLPYLLDLKPYQKQAVTDNINAAIKKLTRFQMSSGFSFWPISNYYNDRYSDWGTSYAGHFLLEAQALGYHVPKALYNHWLSHAQSNARTVNVKNHRYQTYRLFLLALAGKPHIGAMNLVRENFLPNLDPLSRKLLAAAYYLSGKRDVANEVDRSAPTEIMDYRELSGTYGSPLRDRALMTYLCLKMEDLKTAGILLRQVTKSFSVQRWYSTQETSMALLSIGSFYKESPFVGGAVEFGIKMEGRKEKKMSLEGYQTILKLDDMWGKEITISTDSGNPLFVTLFEEGIPLESRITSEHFGIELTRNFYDEDGYPITVNERIQGKSFWVIYTCKSIYSTPLKELALSSVFPSGWEIVNLRLTGETPPPWVQKKQISSGEFMDIRDDRVNWFFDLDGYRTVTFGVKINPTFKGSYALPPVVVEAMYSPEFYAHIEGGKVTVK